MSTGIETSDVENLDVEIVSACLVFDDVSYGDELVLVIADEGNQHQTVIFGDPEIFLLKVQAAIQTANNNDAARKAAPNRATRCEGHAECTTLATWLDNKGYVYCEKHGHRRRAGGTPTRPLRAWERDALLAGQRLQSYSPIPHTEHVRRATEGKATA